MARLLFAGTEPESAAWGGEGPQGRREGWLGCCRRRPRCWRPAAGLRGSGDRCERDNRRRREGGREGGGVGEGSGVGEGGDLRNRGRVQS